MTTYGNTSREQHRERTRRRSARRFLRVELLENRLAYAVDIFANVSDDKASESSLEADHSLPDIVTAQADAYMDSASEMQMTSLTDSIEASTTKTDDDESQLVDAILDDEVLTAAQVDHAFDMLPGDDFEVPSDANDESVPVVQSTGSVDPALPTIRHSLSPDAWATGPIVIGANEQLELSISSEWASRLFSKLEPTRLSISGDIRLQLLKDVKTADAGEAGGQELLLTFYASESMTISPVTGQDELLANDPAQGNQSPWISIRIGDESFVFKLSFSSEVASQVGSDDSSAEEDTTGTNNLYSAEYDITIAEDGKLQVICTAYLLPTTEDPRNALPAVPNFDENGKTAVPGDVILIGDGNAVDQSEPGAPAFQGDDAPSTTAEINPVETPVVAPWIDSTRSNDSSAQATTQPDARVNSARDTNRERTSRPSTLRTLSIGAERARSMTASSMHASGPSETISQNESIAQTESAKLFSGSLSESSSQRWSDQRTGVKLQNRFFAIAKTPTDKAEAQKTAGRPSVDNRDNGLGTSSEEETKRTIEVRNNSTSDVHVSKVDASAEAPAANQQNKHDRSRPKQLLVSTTNDLPSMDACIDHSAEEVIVRAVHESGVEPKIESSESTTSTWMRCVTDSPLLTTATLGCFVLYVRWDRQLSKTKDVISS